MGRGREEGGGGLEASRGVVGREGRNHFILYGEGGGMSGISAINKWMLRCVTHNIENISI